MEAGLWLEARDALAGVAEISRQKGGEGLDIYCLNSPKYRLDLRVGHMSSSPRTPTLWLTERFGHPRLLRQYCPRRLFFSTFSPLFIHITAGQTPLGAKLKQILDIYVPRIEDPSLNHKPVNILVITDGVPSKYYCLSGSLPFEYKLTMGPADDPRQVIVDFA